MGIDSACCGLDYYPDDVLKCNLDGVELGHRVERDSRNGMEFGPIHQ